MRAIFRRPEASGAKLHSAVLMHRNFGRERWTEVSRRLEPEFACATERLTLGPHELTLKMHVRRLKKKKKQTFVGVCLSGLRTHVYMDARGFITV